MAFYDYFRSHLGNCRFCGRRVYWVWDHRGFWAPPFECWVDGTPRGLWVRHRCWKRRQGPWAADRMCSSEEGDTRCSGQGLDKGKAKAPY